MIKKMGELYSVLTIIFIISMCILAIGGCSDDGSGIDNRELMSNCREITGLSSGNIRTPGDAGCTVQIEDGCYFGNLNGSLNGNVETLFETEEEFNVVITKFFESTGVTLITTNNGDTLTGHIVAVANSESTVASGLIQWFPDGSTGQFQGATGYAVLNIETNFENKTYASTYTGIICTP